jgi:molybdopterin-guanine dinucleotide biosynthesis protein A
LQNQAQISGIVLSGGRSLRMGENKAFIKIQGLPIIQRITSLFNQLFNEVIIVTNEQSCLEILMRKYMPT